MVSARLIDGGFTDGSGASRISSWTEFDRRRSNGGRMFSGDDIVLLSIGGRLLLDSSGSSTISMSFSREDALRCESRLVGAGLPLPLRMLMGGLPSRRMVSMCSRDEDFRVGDGRRSMMLGSGTVTPTLAI